uniref:Agmatine deiminase n=1 Tax=Cyanothece sp. (strain PCC 7425 / ATCC 29141) TaxID=395961 RepID=B8HYD8_CYAP4
MANVLRACMTMTSSPADRGYFQPAEWQSHRACWLAFPSHAELWQENLAAAQAEFVQLCRAIADVDPSTGTPRGEQLEILVLDQTGKELASQLLEEVPARFHLLPFGDIWLRDTGPIFLTSAAGTGATVRFQFNGWGQKYELPGDEQVGEQIAKSTGLPDFTIPLIAEGGALEIDGAGTCLTTRQCLLNPNRNPGRTEFELETALKAALGVKKVLWLEEGLLNDHTDGHIDTLARFVAPGVVLCMAPQSQDDPNYVVMRQIEADLKSFTDATDRPLQVCTVPSPGAILDDAGALMPASYMNFYIGNRAVVVPTYGSVFDQIAVATIAQFFPNRRTVGCSAKAILAGGGAFHCITQQQPI